MDIKRFYIGNLEFLAIIELDSIYTVNLHVCDKRIISTDFTFLKTFSNQHLEKLLEDIDSFFLTHVNSCRQKITTITELTFLTDAVLELIKQKRISAMLNKLYA